MDDSSLAEEADEQSVIENVEYALDDDLLFSIVGEFLHCDPKKCKTLPDFRIEELLFLCCRSQSSMINEFKISDSILALYTLCIYFSMKTIYHRSVLERFLTLAQHLIVESLVIIQNTPTTSSNNNSNNNSNSSRCVFSSPLLSSLQKSDEVDVEHKLELFMTCLDYGRSILRETIELHRAMLRVKEMRVEERKAAMPSKTDCLKASSIYFMCGLSLAHVSLALHSVGNIVFVAGVFETLIVMLLTQPMTTAEGSSVAAAAEDNKEDANIGYDFPRSILLTRQLAQFVLHAVSESAYLELVSLSRGHVIKNVIHPAAAFARFKASSFQSALEHSGNKSNKDITTMVVVEGYDNNNKLPVNDPSFHLLNDLSLPLPITAAEGQANAVDGGGDSVAAAGGRHHQTVNAHPNRPLHLQQHVVAPNNSDNVSVTVSISQASNNSNSPSHANNNRKRVIHYHNLKRSFREPFLLLESLRQGHLFYQPNHARNHSSGYSYGGKKKRSGADFNYFLSCFPDEYRPSLDPQPQQEQQQSLATLSPAAAAKKKNKTNSSDNTGHKHPAVESMLKNLSQVNAMSLSWSNTAKLKVLTAILFQHCTACCNLPPPVSNGMIGFLPRVLDPLQPSFWAVQTVLECLLKMAMAGEGICRSLKQEELFLEKKLSVMKKQEQSKYQRLSSSLHCNSSGSKKKMKLTGDISSLEKKQLKLPPIALPPSPSPSPNKKQVILSPPPIASSSALPLSSSLSLEHRFAAASREAALESRLHAISNKIRAVEEERQLKHQQLLLLQQTQLQKQQGNDDGWDIFDDGSLASTSIASLPAANSNSNKDKGSKAVSIPIVLPHNISNNPFDLSNAKYDEQGVLMSVVWHCPPRYKPASQGHFMGTDSLFDYEEDILSHMPPYAASVEYAKEINERKKQEHAEEVRRQQLYKDQQDSIVARNKATKTSIARTLRERTKEEIAAKAAMKAAWEAEKARLDAEAAAKLAMEERTRQEAEMMETLRIAEIKAMRNFIQQRQDEEHQLELEREKAIISMLVDKQEADEIVRRLEEEARMKYLEERRRVIESKNEAIRRAKEEQESLKHQKTLARINLTQHRLRRGNFLWHGGVLGYYDRVRPEEKVAAYVEYDDGIRSYFVDPITNTAQYRRPDDAEIIHHVDEERSVYDAIYGAGSYDAYMADLAFKQAVNRDGGYYDENGEWQAAYGYFDEQNDYRWVAYEGYYDDDGRFVKYAKVQGDLKFMV